MCKYNEKFVNRIIKRLLAVGQYVHPVSLVWRVVSKLGHLWLPIRYSVIVETPSMTSFPRDRVDTIIQGRFDWIKETSE